MDSGHFFINTKFSHSSVSVPQGPFHIPVKVLSDKSTQIASVSQMSVLAFISKSSVAFYLLLLLTSAFTEEERVFMREE